MTRPALFDHAMLPVPSAMPSVPQLCDFVGRHAGGSSRSAGGGAGDGARLTVSAWHKYAKEHFKMDTGYVQLVFDIFFDSTSDGNMTDNSDIHTAEFAVYLFLLSVSQPVPTTGRARPPPAGGCVAPRRPAAVPANGQVGREQGRQAGAPSHSHRASPHQGAAQHRRGLRDVDTHLACAV